MTLEEYVRQSNHACNALCQGRATHAEVMYTDKVISVEDIKSDLEYYIGQYVRIDSVKLAPEAEDRFTYGQRVKLHKYGGCWPDDKECHVSWLVVFTIWGEIEKE